jgi:hypothetical protein
MPTKAELLKQNEELKSKVKELQEKVDDRELHWKQYQAGRGATGSQISFGFQHPTMTGNPQYYYNDNPWDPR